MKLEMKHLSPYLPYGMQFLHKDKCYMLFALELPHDQNPLWITGFNNIESVDGDSVLINVYPEGCKPILRPLSDFNYRDNWGYANKEMFYEDVKNKTIVVKLLEELLEDHIDVFGLIEKGLAIDINDLNN